MKSIKLWRWLQRLQTNVSCFCKSGKLQRGFALARHQNLQQRYLQTMHRYYMPPDERKMLSWDSLYLFPEAQLLADEAKHSIALANYVSAHLKMDQADKVLEKAGHKRFHEMMNYRTRQHRQA